MNNSTDTVDAMNDFPIKTVGERRSFFAMSPTCATDTQFRRIPSAQNGRPATLMTIRKTGGVSTLGGDRRHRRDLARHRAHLLPQGMSIKPIFDQSIFVKAALNSVLMGGLMAAGLTALMILLFLGNWRLTLIILASIPLSIVAARAGDVRHAPDAQHDDAGRIRAGGRHSRRQCHGRHRKHRTEPGHGAIARTGNRRRCGEIATPTLVSTFAICIVFVPVFLLEGTAKYLFSPLSLSVIVALLASLVFSFTLVPVLFKFLMQKQSACMHEQITTSDRRAQSVFVDSLRV